MSVLSAKADRRLGRTSLAGAGAIVSCAILLPIAALLFAAVREGTPGQPGATWTVASLAEVYTTSRLATPLFNTLQTCAPGTLLALVAGVLLAWAVIRTNMPGRRRLEPLLLAPIYFSPLALAVGWVALYAPRIGLINVALHQTALVDVYSVSAITLFIGLYYAPYVYLMVAGTLRQMDAGYEDAAAVLGSRPMRRLMTVTLPMLRPQLLAASLLVFTQSTTMFAEPLLFGTRIGFTNLPITIYDQIISFPSNYNFASAISTLLMLVSLLGLFLYRRALQAGERFVSAQSRGFSYRQTDLGVLRWPFALGVWFYLASVVILPVAGLILTSLLRFISPTLEWENIGLTQWQGAFADPGITSAIGNTLVLAAGVATVTTLLGFLTGYAIVRRQLPLSRFIDAVSVLPVGVPGIVLGVGFLWAYLWIPFGIYGTIWTLVIALCTVVVPQAVRNVDAALRQLGHQPEEAAMVLGAGTGRILIQIVLPLLRASLVSTWLFVFMLTAIQVSIPLVLRTAGVNVLSLAVWSTVTEGGNLPRGSAVALIQGALAAGVVLIASRAARGHRVVEA